MKEFDDLPVKTAFFLFKHPFLLLVLILGALGWAISDGIHQSNLPWSSPVGHVNCIDGNRSFREEIERCPNCRFIQKRGDGCGGYQLPQKRTCRHCRTEYQCAEPKNEAITIGEAEYVRSKLGDNFWRCPYCGGETKAMMPFASGSYVYECENCGLPFVARVHN